MTDTQTGNCSICGTKLRKETIGDQWTKWYQFGERDKPYDTSKGVTQHISGKDMGMGVLGLIFIGVCIGVIFLIANIVDPATLNKLPRIVPMFRIR